jgi:hypothetical protein
MKSDVTTVSSYVLNESEIFFSECEIDVEIVIE